MKQFSEATRQRMSEAAKNRCTPEWRKKKSEQQSTKLDLQKVKDMYDSGMTQHEIAAVLEVTQKVMWRFMKNNGIKARVANKRNQYGENNNSWKGGRAVTDRGYVVVRMPEHPRASQNGYVFEHILVAEKKLGRELRFLGTDNPDSEVVHHKNHIKNDNNPDNLEVMTISEHVKLHNAIRRGGGSNAKRKHDASA